MRALLFALIAAPLGPAPAAGGPADLSGFLPRHQEYRVEILDKTGTARYVYTKSVDVGKDGLVTVRELGPDYDSTARLDRGLRLLESRVAFKNRADVDRQGYDARVCRYDVRRRLMVLTAVAGGREKYRREIKYGKETVELETLPLRMQALTVLGKAGFAGMAVDLNDGQQWPMRMRLASPGEKAVLAGRKYPGQVRNMAGNAGSLVYVMEVTGWLRILYPFRFYLVLAKAWPHRIMIYWGERPGGTAYQVFKAGR